MNITFYRELRTEPHLLVDLGKKFAKSAGLKEIEVVEFSEDKPPAVLLATAMGDYASFLLGQKGAEITAALAETGEMKARTKLQGTNIPMPKGRRNSRVNPDLPKSLQLVERPPKDSNVGNALADPLRKVLITSRWQAEREEDIKLDDGSTRSDLLGMGSFWPTVVMQTSQDFLAGDVVSFTKAIGNSPGLLLGPVMPALWDTEDDIPVSFGSLNKLG